MGCGFAGVLRRVIVRFAHTSMVSSLALKYPGQNVRIIEAPLPDTAYAAKDPNDQLRVAIAQLIPVWLNREATLAKVADTIQLAADQDCKLVVFGEALVPGYPFWLELTGGARFDNDEQKAMHARYLREGVDLQRGDLAAISALANRLSVAVYLGVMERAGDRGGHSLYCTLVYIDGNGEIRSTHRKLQPTYEERLAWASGDGNGLVTHPLGPFTLGGLNCWENWMPMARAALYGQGSNLHVSVWPGGTQNTADITRFIARESRSYVIASCGLLPKANLPKDLPMREAIIANAGDFLANGGSTLVGPDGRVLVEPVAEEEVLITATLDHAVVRAERQNFDPAGHYSRPDVLQLSIDQRRQSTIRVIPDGANE